MSLPDGAVESIRRYEKKEGTPLRVMLLWDSRVKDEDGVKERAGINILVTCDFSKPEKIAACLLPYKDELLAVTCRSEKSIARFAQVIPHVPYLRTSSTESLAWATDKYMMRRRMKLFDPKITPRFTLVRGNSKTERVRIKKQIGFPLIIKPTNMAASLFVSVCYHEEDLDKTLRSAFRRLPKAYRDDGRLEEPRVLAEEYMDGDMYSVDSYVNSRGDVYHCPLVKVVTGKKIGHDDFYNYLRITPTVFKKTTIERAEAATATAINALGMRNTTVHTELMKLDDEWKIIELGPRVGGFRHTLHQLSCDIDHSLNDVLVRIPKRPLIPRKCKGFAAAMKWFAGKEGKIIEMKGVKKIEQLDSFQSIAVNKKIGDRAVFARNGGRSIFNLLLYNHDRSALLADIRRVEQMVKIKVAERASRKKST